MKTRERLVAAADLIEENGWKQGAYGGFRNDCHCAAGAIKDADPSDPYPDAGELRRFKTPPGKAIKRFAQFLLETGKTDHAPVKGETDWHDTVVKWNDRRVRTKNEVLTALRGASKKRSEW